MGIPSQEHVFQREAGNAVVPSLVTPVSRGRPKDRDPCVRQGSGDRARTVTRPDCTGCSRKIAGVSWRLPQTAPGSVADSCRNRARDRSFVRLV
jgi:hypothetical protein